MEKKVAEKAKEAECLEEENIGLKEVTRMLSKKIDQIESEIDARKVREKSNREAELNADLSEL
jgi:hypothetical protein